MKQNKRIGVSDILLAALSLVYLLGTLLVFRPCGPKGDGTWMHCHWAGVAVSVCAAVLLALSVIHMAAGRPGVKMALSGVTILVAVAAAVIPGNVIHLCMMADMRCRAVMQPAVIVFSILVIAAAALDLITQRKRGKS